MARGKDKREEPAKGATESMRLDKYWDSIKH